MTKNHKPTKLVPDTLIKDFSMDECEQFLERTNYVQGKLEHVLGKPYYSNNGFILFNKSCIEVLDELKKIEFQLDLTITSPPYNIGKEYETNLDIKYYVDWCEKWMNLIYDNTTDDGTFWLNVGYFEVPDKGLCVPIPYLLWDKSDFYLLQELVWKYGAGVQTKKRLSPRNEKWLYYVKNSNSYTFNLDEIRDLNVKYPNQKKNGKLKCNPLGKNPSDVWDFPKVTSGASRSSKERVDHPAQFPLSIIERLVKASSTNNCVVMDPFSGSGTTGIAAVALNRIFLGTEVNKKYCDVSIERFENFLNYRKEVLSQQTIL
ncbi:DNA-methyltransferase [Candidatus Enterovibrio escicola]|uniref:DNA-methyltransferase n=2 Tax=Candidatus Enterovibrio escicola TaxID=1927127 RepID=UPI0012383B6B|nr:site-specific DNA-methyltransferase [Candidatus Enterovibrio escacola]